MKHIGIVSVSGPGSAIAFQSIAEASMRTGLHPMVTMHHLSFETYLEAINREDWNRVADYLLESLAVLKKAGADFAIIPVNTVHFAIDRVLKESPIPVISILDCTSESIHERGFKKVAVLGTRFTTRNKLYEKTLLKYGITEAVLSDELIDAIHHLIMDDILPGKINLATVERIGEKLKQIECDCFAFSCTDLPVVFSPDNLLKPCVDTAQVLAEAAFKEATV